MQNRYVGDIGDFGKYGLLRFLLGLMDDPVPECLLRLGIVWYLHPNESHNSDGKYIGYLTRASRSSEELRICDPDLYDSLRRLVSAGERSVVEVRGSGILPDDAEYYERSLSYTRGQSRLSRQSTRLRWINEALRSTAKADVIFVDPDNGISATADPLRKNGPKFVFMDDLRGFAARDQTLVIYHHIGRQGTAVEQIKRLGENLQANLELNAKPWTLWYHRGTARAYFIIAQERHDLVLKNRLSLFLNGPWSKHFELVG